MLKFIKDIELIAKKFNKKELRKLQIQSLISILKKLDENNKQDEELLVEVQKLVDSLELVNRGNKSQWKIYNKLFQTFSQNVKKKYGFIRKGTILGTYVAFGIIVGSIVMVTFMAVNPTISSLGISFGIVFGVTIGNLMEQKAEKEGKLY